MPSAVVRQIRRLLDAGSQRVDFSHPGARVAVALLGIAAVAALAATAWFVLQDSRSVTPNFYEIQQAYVKGVREKIQVATDAAADERLRLGAARSLRLRIVVSPDGRLVSASIVESSGNKAVDDLTLRVVRESAPFEPFPERMRRYTTIVEINSTFEFR